MLHLAKAAGLLSLCRALTSETPRILCYHGGSLGDEHLFNPKLFMRGATFARRIEWLHAMGFRSIDLDELVQSTQGKIVLGPRTVVVTFDDGWLSTAQCLLPHLDRFGFKSTLYLATKVFEAGTPVIDVTVNYLIWRSPLKKVRLGQPGMASPPPGEWSLETASDRRRLAEVMMARLKAIDSDAKAVEGELSLFADALSVAPQHVALASRRFHYMNRDELMAVARSGTSVELHGHIHHYPIGQPEALREDVEACRKSILAVGLPRPRHYCYPSGVHDSNAATVLSSMDVASATTCLGSSPKRAVNAGSLFELPRFLDGEDVAMIEFEAEMSGLLHILRGWRERLPNSRGRTT